MLAEADAGILFNAPERVTAEFPQFPSVVGYSRLRDAFRAASIRDL
jgi:phosphoserine/homoserine phosphotransferase